VSVETPEFLAMVERMIRAAGRRVAIADEEELAVLVRLHTVLEEAVSVAVAGQRESGSSWTQLGRGLGTTRQGAQQRFGERISA